MMPRSLFAKELRHILPWALTIAGVEVAGVLLRLVDRAPDQVAWVELTHIFNEYDAIGRAFLLGVWAMVLAYAGFPREYDDRTLPFLVSLPVSRPRLFLSKQASAAIVLLSIVALTETLHVLVQLPNRGSFGGHTLRWDWALVSFGLSSAVALLALGYAALLSVFRRFGILLALLTWLVFSWLRDLLPALRPLDLLTLLHVEFSGTEPIVPWAPLGGHALASGLCAALAALFWLGYAERWPDLIAKVVGNIVVRVASGVAFVVALIAGIVIAFDTIEEPESFGVLEAFDSPDARLETRHYRFRYPSALEARMKGLARSGDELYERAARLLGADPRGGRIEVTLTERSATHAGSASWNAIRIDPRHAFGDRELERTLVHETVHALALRVSDRRLRDANDTLRVFNEGLAEHIALALVPSAQETEARWLEAALIYRRSRPEPELLFDLSGFLARFREQEVYPLGLTLVSALTSACGKETPARALSALTRADAPRDLGGWSLFQDTLQSFGCDSSRVLLRWGELMESACEERKHTLESVAKLAGGIASADEEGIVVRAEIEGSPPEDAMYSLLVRDGADATAGDYQVFIGEVTPGGAVDFRIYDEAIGGQTLEYQFVTTWLVSGAATSHSTEWRRALVPR
jgi:hypothetical protein